MVFSKIDIDSLQQSVIIFYMEFKKSTTPEDLKKEH
jgi:hypothetical protein